MSWLGRYRLGDRVPVTIRTTTAEGVAQQPDRCPTALICRLDSPSAVESHYLTSVTPGLQAGNFTHELFLDSSFTEGYYLALARAEIDAAGLLVEYTFQVVGGGDEDGMVHSIQGWVRPESEVLISALESGKLVAGRNPTLREFD